MKANIRDRLLLKTEDGFNVVQEFLSTSSLVLSIQAHTRVVRDGCWRVARDAYRISI